VHPIINYEIAAHLLDRTRPVGALMLAIPNYVQHNFQLFIVYF